MAHRGGSKSCINTINFNGHAIGTSLLKVAYDRGINTWDPVNVHSSGESERMTAKAIKKYHLPRHKLVFMTKCSGYVPEETTWRHMFYEKEMPVSKDYVNQGGQFPSLFPLE